MIVGGVTALIAAGGAARWWIRWPERVAEQLATLVSEGEFEKANRFLVGGAEWSSDSSPLIKLHDGSGETPALGGDEWKELFTARKLKARSRTSADYLHARQVLETVVPSSRLSRALRGRGRPAPVRVVFTIERGAVSVRIVEEPGGSLELFDRL